MYILPQEKKGGGMKGLFKDDKNVLYLVEWRLLGWLQMSKFVEVNTYDTF